MNLSSALQALLPTLFPIFVGYAVARWAGVGTKSLSKLVQYVFFPAVMFIVLQTRMELGTFVIVAGIGAAMAAAGVLLSRNSKRVIAGKVDLSAAALNIACFSIPFLGLSWGARGVGTACSLYVGMAVTLRLFESGRDVKPLLREPWALATILALAVHQLGIHLDAINGFVSPFATAAYPLLLVLLGTALHPLGSFSNREAWLTVGIRVVSGFAVAALAIVVLPLSVAVAEGLMLVALAPPAAAAVTLGGSRHDSDRARDATILGTLVSLGLIALLLVTGWKPWQL